MRFCSERLGINRQPEGWLEEQVDERKEKAEPETLNLTMLFIISAVFAVRIVLSRLHLFYILNNRGLPLPQKKKGEVDEL